MIKINKHFKINNSMIMYKRINTYKYDSSLLNWTLHTATLFLITESVSNELCTKWRVRGTQCVYDDCFLCFCIKPSGHYCSAVSASTSKLLLEVKFVNLFHFLQWEMLDLVQQHKSTSWLFYWTFGRCWTDGVSECRRNRPRLITENKPNTPWTWLRVNHTGMVSGVFAQSSSAVFCPFKAQNELRHHASTSISKNTSIENRLFLFMQHQITTVVVYCYCIVVDPTITHSSSLFARHTVYPAACKAAELVQVLECAQWFWEHRRCWSRWAHLRPVLGSGGVCCCVVGHNHLVWRHQKLSEHFR